MYLYIYINAIVVIILRSAPNYCYRSGNIAAILQLDDSLEQTYVTFSAVPASVRQTPEKQTVPYFL